MANVLHFTSGPATLVDPSHIQYLDQPSGLIEGIKEVPLEEPDHRLFLTGEFGRFRIYALVTHTRVEIVPSSVKRITPDCFTSLIKLELSQGTITTHRAVFKAPIVPYADVRAATYGLFPDAFEFLLEDSRREKFPCSLSFLLDYAEGYPAIPLRVEYIGIAKGEKREAQHRLGEGHEKLQKLLAAQNRRQGMQTTSIVLYRPSELEPPVLSFEDVLETVEATMIQYFKPAPLNILRLDFPHDSPALTAKLKAIGVQDIHTSVESPQRTQLFSVQVSAAANHAITVTLP